MKVAIIGGGAVGLLQAILLEKEGVDVTVYEKLIERPSFKRIVGLDGKSLSVFDELGFVDEVIGLGKKICNAKVYHDDKTIADFSLERIHRDYPFFLTFSLSDLEVLLESKVKNIKKGMILKGIEKNGLIFSDGSKVIPDLIIGADGSNSCVRSLAGIKTKEFTYPFTLEIANQRVDKEERMIQLFFEKGKTAALRFPYSLNHVQVIRVMDPKHPSIDKKKTVRGEDESVFNLLLEKKLAATFFQDRVLLLGDAAHHMTPFGGRGLSLSIQDAKIYAKSILDGSLKKTARRRRLLARRVILETHIIAMMEARGRWLMIIMFKAVNRLQIVFNKLMSLHVNIIKGRK